MKNAKKNGSTVLISNTMNRRLNEQITNELSASHNYLAMSSDLNHIGLTVFSHWFLAQSNEERKHALKIVKYVEDVGGTVQLSTITPPAVHYDSARAVVDAALQAELVVTKQINELMALAEEERDYASRSFLQWFVNEQVEEVRSMTELLQWIDLAGDNNLMLVESRLADRKEDEDDED